MLGGNKLNEFIFQYADFLNDITARSRDPLQTFPNGVAIGQNANTPQSTQQKKWQFRNDFSWHVTGMGGVGHDFKAGVNFINEPTLYVEFSSLKGVAQYMHLTDSVSGPISAVTLNDGDASANIPLKQYAFFVQDDWAVSDKLTLNLGLRYDLMTATSSTSRRTRTSSRCRPRAGPGCSMASRAWRISARIRRRTPTTCSRASDSPMTCAVTART